MGVPYSIFCCFKSTTEARLIDLESGGGGTYSTDVNTMLASVNNAGIRSAIGVGTTNAPAFAGLSTTGNVGVGTASPASGLHISGALGTNTTTYDSAAALKLTNTSGGSWLVTSGVIGVANANFSIRQESVAQPAIVVTAIGNNVGIGLNTPTSKLDILDTALSGSGSLAGSALNIAQTWNTIGTPSAIKLNVTDTASHSSSRLLELQTGGVTRFFVNKLGLLASTASGGDGGGAIFGGSLITNSSVYTGQYGIRMAYNVALSWSSGLNLNTLDLNLQRDDAPGILAQRNLGAPQTLRVYNSTDATPATNFDRASFGFTSNTLRIGTENGGTYTTARPIDFVTGGVARWQISAAGHFLAVTDNAVDIGASGANRPRNIYAATSFLLPFNGSFLIESRLNLSCPTNGRLLLANSTATDFDRFQLGGTTDAFPSIARDGAGIKITGSATGSTSWIKVPAVAVASLPAAATAGVGARSFVNDALTPVFGNAVAGSGLSKVPVYSDGTNWNVG